MNRGKKMSFLTFDNVSHYYFSKDSFTKAIEHVSFSVAAGEFCSIIGPSGCGKSTILSIIARLIRQTEGDVYIKHKRLHETDYPVGYMLQQDYLFPWKTVWENVLIGPKIKHEVTKEMTERADALLDEGQLAHTKNMYPDGLSGGMRQRVALVRTLVTHPELLLFDEAFSALDYVTKLNLENVVAKLMKAYNKTAILVTHDLGEAISMSDRIFLMESAPGRIAKTFEVPTELRNETPFFVRRRPEYQPIFDEIWQHLNDDMSEMERGLAKYERNN